MDAENSPGAKPVEREFVISRVFDAPRELVFKAWTETERLKHWWGPQGFTMLSCKCDPRPGGVFHYGMRAPDGMVMWGKWVFRDIVKPERLVFVLSFSDEAGGETRHPRGAGLAAGNAVVTFAEHDGRTTLTMRGIPINATESERKTFVAGHGSMQQGWTGTMNQLADYLTKA